MIVTLTLNPSVDRTVEVEALDRGSVVRALGVHVDAGGKGINVSRALAAHGVKTRAVVTTGGAEGEHLVALLEADGIDILPVPVPGATRSNIAVVEPDGTTTKFNEPGAPLDAGQVAACVNAVTSSVSGADWVVASGSLPPGVEPGFYADLARTLRASGALLAVDTSGQALSAVLHAEPALVKPNRDELAESTGIALHTIGDVVDAARQLHSRGARAVLASLGRDGAVLVDDDGAVFGAAPEVVPVSSVGAGDAMLAGFLSAGGRGPDALAAALSWGAAAASLPGSRMPGPDDVIHRNLRLVQPPDRTRELSPAP